MATVGSTSAPSTNTVYYDALLTTTTDALFGSGQLFDNIFRDSAFLAAMRDMGGVTYQDGGERIRAPLMYESNSTIKSYSGEDIIDTTLQDGLTTAFYEWAEVGGTIGITRREQRQNSGEAALLQLLEAKTKQAEMSMREALNSQILAGTVSASTFVPGNSAKDLFPLGYFLRKVNSTDPTTGGNVGNISGSTYSWWRHHTGRADSGTLATGNSFAVSVSSYAALKVALKRLYNYCSRGSGGAPNLGICDQITFETYENALDTQVRYTNTRLADMGFDNIKLRGATLVWDEVVPDLDNGYAWDSASFAEGTCFLLNTNFFKLVIDTQTDIVNTPFQEPDDQTLMSSKVLFMGNTVCSNLRKLGVLYGIAQNITS